MVVFDVAACSLILLLRKRHNPASKVLRGPAAHPKSRSHIAFYGSASAVQYRLQAASLDDISKPNIDEAPRDAIERLYPDAVRLRFRTN